MNLTNFYDHPQDNRYLVFRFFDEKLEGAFEEKLIQEGIPFEKDNDVNEVGNSVVYFGVSKTHKTKAVEANYLVYGQFRRPMIPNPYLRYGFLILVIGMIALAIVGAILKQQ